jgi:hypothetical protein
LSDTPLDCIDAFLPSPIGKKLAETRGRKLVDGVVSQNPFSLRYSASDIGGMKSRWQINRSEAKEALTDRLTEFYKKGCQEK